MKLGASGTRKATFRSIGIFIAVLSVIALVALMVPPALAHHKDGHTQGGGTEATAEEHGKGSTASSDHDGDADSDSSTSYTEDNDTNDGGTPNNVADEGDNAHPSGKDRSVENGGSGTQGKSESNPDDSKGPMRYEGAIGDDKPNGPGGTDLADQDGNNGCGNDDDFDDDNNGHCGRKKNDTSTPVVVTPIIPTPIVQPSIEEKKVCPAGTDFPGTEMETLADCNKDIVLGSIINRSIPKALTAPAAAAAPANVLGGAVLPFTGGDVAIFLVLGLALIVLGAVTLKLRSN